MSWFQRKSMNRRLGRGHVLSVKLRSSHVRAKRVRLVALSFGILFGTVFGLYLLWRTGEWALNRLVYENPAFAIRQIDVQTDGVITHDQLRRWAGVKLGENLVALDLARVRRDLKLSSLIEWVAVERVLPNTLRLRVVEREPLARVLVLRPVPNGGCEVKTLQLDLECNVILPLERQQRTTPPTPADDLLPVLEGLQPNELVPAKRLESPQARAAMQLITAFERSPMAGVFDLRRIDLSSPDILQVTTWQGSDVTFATKDLERQLLRWAEVHKYGQTNNVAIASVDLSVTNNVPVRWMATNAVAPAMNRKINPQRYKKKNV